MIAGGALGAAYMIEVHVERYGFAQVWHGRVGRKLQVTVRECEYLGEMYISRARTDI